MTRWMVDPRMHARPVDPLDDSWGLPPGILPSQVLRRLNGRRAEAGAAALVAHPPLMQAAQAHASAMARGSFLGTRAPDGTTLNALARRAGHHGDVVGWVLRAPSLDLGMQTLLRDAGLGHVLAHPACRQVGLGLCAGRFTLLLGAPFVLDEEASRIRAHQMLNHARTLQGLPPLASAEALDQLAEALCTEGAAAPAVYPGRVCHHIFDAPPASLKGALFEALEDPVFGAAVRDPAYSDLGVFTRAGGVRCCLVLGSPARE